MSGRKNDDDMAVGCLAWIILLIVAMPAIGVYWLISGDTEKKIAGLILTFVGFGIWIYLGSR